MHATHHVCTMTAWQLQETKIYNSCKICRHCKHELEHAAHMYKGAREMNQATESLNMQLMVLMCKINSPDGWANCQDDLMLGCSTAGC